MSDIFDKNQEYYGHPRPEMLAFVPASAKTVLDIGCGTGLFAAAVKTRGAEVWGVELSDAAELAKQRLTRVIQLPIERPPSNCQRSTSIASYSTMCWSTSWIPWKVLRLARN
jgi:2-polyprenyl-3-methyl-5-hydroxy-6-metoxy-1,4-benzoquinol methylase